MTAPIALPDARGPHRLSHLWLSAWGLKLEEIKQQNLVITQTDEPAITVDNTEVAQFIYLLLHNQKVGSFGLTNRSPQARLPIRLRATPGHDTTISQRPISHRL